MLEVPYEEVRCPDRLGATVGNGVETGTLTKRGWMQVRSKLRCSLSVLDMTPRFKSPMLTF